MSAFPTSTLTRILMKSINKYFFLASFIVTCSIVPFIPRLWLKYTPVGDIHCTGNISFYRENRIMRLSSKIILRDNNGVIYLNGSIRDGSDVLVSINRSISFESSNVNGQYKWLATSIHLSMASNIEDKLASEWLPSFYREVGGVTNVYIEKANFDSILIFGEFVPYLICSK